MIKLAAIAVMAVATLATATTLRPANVAMHWSPQAPTDGGGDGQNFTEDFNTNPSSRWNTISGLGATWYNSSEYRFTNSTTVIYTVTQPDTISQYAYVKYVEDAYNSYAGVYFRSTNNASEAAYAFRYQRLTTNFVWRGCEGHSCTTIETSGSHTLQNGDFFGIEVTGTSDSTQVVSYDCGASEPTNGDFSGCTTVDTMNDNPRSICTGSGSPVSYCTGSGTGTGADSGKYTGLYSGSSAAATFDDFGGGDI